MLLEKLRRFGVFLALFALNAVNLLAGGEPATEYEHNVDLSKLSGLSYFIADLYNNHRLLFAILVTATMSLLGLLISIGSDKLLKSKGKTAHLASH